MSEQDLHDRAARLRERVDQDYAEAWDFKEIPAVTGVVEGYARIDTVNGARVVCTIREVDGGPEARRYGVWLSQKALLERFKELRPAQGELVSIRYLGQSDHAAAPGYSPAHRFRVEVDRPGASFNWSELEADDQRPRRDEAPVGADDRWRDPGPMRPPTPPSDDEIPF